MTDPLPINDFKMLRFDWQAVTDREVVSIHGLGESTMDDGSLRWASIAIVLDEVSILLRVDEDTDQIIVTLAPAELSSFDNSWADIDGLQEMVGRPLGWCWVSCNSQGYLDAFTISIDGIDPEYMFVGAASELECRRAKTLRAPGHSRQSEI